MLLNFLWSIKPNFKKKTDDFLIFLGLLLCVPEGDKKRYPNIETMEKSVRMWGLFSCKMDKEFIKKN